MLVVEEQSEQQPVVVADSEQPVEGDSEQNTLGEHNSVVEGNNILAAVVAPAWLLVVAGQVVVQKVLLYMCIGCSF